MLLMIEKGLKGGICHVIHRYAKANNKYTKNYDNLNIVSSYLVYVDANSLQCKCKYKQIACKWF